MREKGVRREYEGEIRHTVVEEEERIGARVGRGDVERKDMREERLYERFHIIP